MKPLPSRKAQRLHRHFSYFILRLKKIMGQRKARLVLKYRYLKRKLKLQWELADKKELLLLALATFFYPLVVWLSIYAGATYWNARQLILDRKVQREVRIQEMIRDNLYLRKENNELKREIEKLRSARAVPLGGTTDGSVGSYPTGECFNLSLLFPIEGSAVVTNFSRYHPGIDIAGDYGTPVLASYSGIVASAGWHSSGYGYSVFLNIGGGWQWRLAHLSKILVKTGQTVTEGQRIGLVGMSGTFSDGSPSVTGSHLHAELSCNSEKVDPRGYFLR